MNTRISEVVLEKIRLETVELVAPYLMDAKFSADYLPHLANTLQMRVRGYLMGDKHPDKVVKYPKTWWDAFKVDCFPDWAFDKWPPNYTHHRFTFQSLYPDFKPKLPPGQSKCVIQSYNWKASEGGS